MLTINTLGKFYVVNGDKRLTDEDLHSTKVLKLFAYIILYRDRMLTMEDMAQAIWQDEEVENPIGALKNLMYRLRKVLNEVLGENDYIITKRGSYCWNSEIGVIHDVDHFESLISEAKLENNPDTAMVRFEQAVELFQGDFMPKIADMNWVSTLNTYYHSLYLTAVKTLADKYIQKKRYEDLEQLCNHAIKLEPADEQLFSYLVVARMRCGKVTLALETYEKACRILEKELGIRKAVMLGRVYEELLAVSNGEVKNNMEEIQADIVEEKAEGAFLCGYPVFKEIYHLEARKSVRSGEEKQMVLLSLEPKVQEHPNIMNYRMNQSMDALENIIRGTLRLGDVASKYSDTQFVLMLFYCTEELAYLVANRIINHFYQLGTKYEMVKVSISVAPVTVDSDMLK